MFIWGFHSSCCFPRLRLNLQPIVLHDTLPLRWALMPHGTSGRHCPCRPKKKLWLYRCTIKLWGIRKKKQCKKWKLTTTQESLDWDSTNQHWDIIIKHRGFTNTLWTPDSSKNEGPTNLYDQMHWWEHDDLCYEMDWLIFAQIRRSHRRKSSHR